MTGSPLFRGAGLQQGGFDWWRVAGLGDTTLAIVPNGLSASDIAATRAAFASHGDRLLAQIGTQGYPAPTNSTPDYYWGSNATVANVLALAWRFGRRKGRADTTPPTAPTGLAASGTTADGTNLSWTASTDNVGVTGYDIYRRQGTNGGFTQVGWAVGTSFAATGLSPATRYHFHVVARDAAGNSSPPSAAVTVTTLPGGGCSVTATTQSQWAPAT